MDFFEAEGRAKKRTSRLLVLFGLAVAGTVVAGYFATSSSCGPASGYGRHGRHADAYYADPALRRPGRVPVAAGALRSRRPQARWP
jgi:hypothetical protein